MTTNSIWEQKYSSGHSQKYPWDLIVSFVFRHAPRDVLKSHIRILEVGCGTGSNLWFAAREGFDISGIDFSPSAIDQARRRLQQDDLSGELVVGDFTKLPFANSTFDIIFDRCSLACVNTSDQLLAVSEIHRCLKPNGIFLHNTYTDNHSSFFAGTLGVDGLCRDIKAGTLVGFGAIKFSSLSEVRNLFKDQWSILKIERRENCNFTNSNPHLLHSEWVVIVKKNVLM